MYTETRSTCDAGCEGGACLVPEDPCAEVVCNEAPRPVCDGETAVRYTTAGTCVAGACDYPASPTDCAARGQTCREGACVDPSPCTLVDCEQPTPYCDRGIAYVPTSLGCNEATGACEVSTTETDCTAIGQRCEAGACLAIDRCVDVNCDTPPAATCEDGEQTAYAAAGTCQPATGDCDYAPVRSFCSDDARCFEGRCTPNTHCVFGDCTQTPQIGCDGQRAVSQGATGTCNLDTGACEFPSTERDCEAEGLRCVDGSCLAPLRCEGVTCETPPAARCDGTLAYTYTADGTCQETTGTCTYPEAATNCAALGEVCVAGACVPDPCAGVACDAPPVARCEGDLAIGHEERGICQSGSCTYPPRPEDCNAAGLTCADGRCVPRDPCAGISCEVPPAATCDGDVASTYESAGICIDGTCRFSPRNRDCAAGGLTCRQGRCVEPTSCDGVVCNAPQVATCDGQIAVTPLLPGVCAGGSCSYSERRTNCANIGQVCVAGACIVPDLCAEEGCNTLPEDRCQGDIATQYREGICVESTGFCDYPADFVDCAARGETCWLGACLEDRCAGQACDSPPSATCDGDSVVQASGGGLCDPVDGFCTYPTVSVDCAARGDVCLDGACVGPCAAVVCDDPPAGTCAGSVATNYAAGVCANGDCSYAPVQEDCGATGRVCLGGTCVSSPCAGIACDAPPSPSCDAGTLVTAAAPGTCAGGDCFWVETRRDCLAEGLVCRDGGCRNPCSGIACDDAPTATCDGLVARQWDAEGVCVGNAECVYTERTTNCAAVGLVCIAGACAPSPCQGVSCDAAPAGRCDGAVRLSYAQVGVCADGDCTYEETAFDCSAAGNTCFGGRCVGACDAVVCDAPPADTCAGEVAIAYQSTGTCDAGDCTYVSATTDCAAAGLTCVAGACVAGPCTGIACETPPAPTCDGDDRLVFAQPGACLGGDCLYNQTRESCAALQKVCVAGACVDACDGVICDERPSPRCDGTELVTYPVPGVCATGTCRFTEQRVSCAASGLACVDGACVPDACTGVFCDLAPGPVCDGGVAIVFDAPGTCADGACGYTELRTNCLATGDVCTGGQCVDTCTTLVCDTPPSNRCDAGQAVRYAAAGSCAGGACSYSETRTLCSAVGLVCAAGACVPGPCDGVVCDVPPEASCEGNVRVAPAAIGVCAGGACSYPLAEQDCASAGLVCLDGRCVGACDFVSCAAPPSDFCDVTVAVQFASLGDCEDGNCDYPAVRTDCVLAGQVCQAGRCVPSPCEGVACDAPAPPSCEGETLVTQAPAGVCADGSCVYDTERILCTALGFVCQAGACVDPCAGNACPTGPAPLCEGDVAVVAVAPGTCSFGTCSFSEIRTNCALNGQRCQGGACVDGPCVGVACDAPPAPTCTGNVATQFLAGGICDDGTCSYAPTTVNCASAGQVCDAGACVDACSITVCDDPPPVTCIDGVFRGFRAGICSNGVCSYEPDVIDCVAEGGICQDGACFGLGTCTGVLCNTPPFNSCEGDVATRYADGGLCLLGACDYDTVVEDCGASGQRCRQGFCFDDLCRDVVCNNPPASTCQGNLALAFQSEGVCDEFVGGCTYLGARDDCAIGGRTCVAGVCIGGGSCDGVTCSTPPAPFCTGNLLVTSATAGVCLGGECAYEQSSSDCSVFGRTCRNGACEDIDCETVTCDSPPAPTCIDGAAFSYSGTGTCALGTCNYPGVRDNCAARGVPCVAGRCDDGGPDLCVGVVCAPPDPFCEGNSVISFAGPGICQRSSGNCDYELVRVEGECGDALCVDGACLQVGPRPDEVVIAEVFGIVQGTPLTRGWLELWNTSPRTIDVSDIEVVNASSGARFTLSPTVPLRIRGDQVLVLAADPDGAGQTASVIWPPTFQLSPTVGILELWFSDVRIDAMQYDATWPLVSGRATALDPDAVEVRDVPDAWCSASDLYAPQERGTPGVRNPVCEE